jgi:hypothetical protein
MSQQRQIMISRLIPTIHPLFFYFPANFIKMQLIFVLAVADPIGAPVIATWSFIKNGFGVRSADKIKNQKDVLSVPVSFRRKPESRPNLILSASGCGLIMLPTQVL